MRPWLDPAYEAIAEIVNARTGLVFGASCRGAAESGMRRAMGRAGVDTLGSYLNLVMGASAAFDDLIDELTVRETYFFRHSEQFDFIRSRILPDVQRRRGQNHFFQAWSAGCASGEEAYSLAIVFKQERLAEKSSILATDISRLALLAAGEAAYGSMSLRRLPGEFVRRYFHRRGHREVLDDRIRSQVSFRCANLSAGNYIQDGCPPYGMDLILCRNVLIYLDKHSVRQVAGRLFRSLAEGGWLITGASDPPLGNYAPFETVVTDRGVFYRRGPSKPVVSKASAGLCGLRTVQNARSAPMPV